MQLLYCITVYAKIGTFENNQMSFTLDRNWFNIR